MFENYSESDRPMLQSAYNVITTMEKWSFLKHNSVKEPYMKYSANLKQRAYCFRRGNPAQGWGFGPLHRGLRHAFAAE